MPANPHFLIQNKYAITVQQLYINPQGERSIVLHCLQQGVTQVESEIELSFGDIVQFERQTQKKLLNQGLLFLNNKVLKVQFHEQLLALLENPAAHNITIQPTLSNNGWLHMHGQDLLAIGHQIYTLDPDTERPQHTASKLAASAKILNGFGQHGNPDHQQHLLNQALSQCPEFGAAIYAALSSPLISLLQLNNGESFIFHLAGGLQAGDLGSSSIGKTITLKSAASLLGNPELLRQTWASSQASVMNLMAALQHLPLFLDEVSTEDDDKIAQQIYDLGNNTAGARATSSGGLRDTRKWAQIILSTGEYPLRNTSHKRGVGARTLEMLGSPFQRAQNPAQLASDLATSCQHHYGLALPAYPLALIALKHQPEVQAEIRELYTSLVNSVYQRLLDLPFKLAQDTGRLHRKIQQIVTVCAGGALAQGILDLSADPARVLETLLTHTHALEEHTLPPSEPPAFLQTTPAEAQTLQELVEWGQYLNLRPHLPEQEAPFSEPILLDLPEPRATAQVNHEMQKERIQKFTKALQLLFADPDNSAEFLYSPQNTSLTLSVTFFHQALGIANIGERLLLQDLKALGLLILTRSDLEQGRLKSVANMHGKTRRVVLIHTKIFEL